MKKNLLVPFVSGCLLLMATSYVFSQAGINTDGSQPDPSAMLDVKATNRGLLIPRISTAARDLVPSPATGLLIYNTTTNQFNYYNGSYWYQLETAFISSTTGTLNPGGGVSINASPNVSPDNSAMLDVNNPTRGILIPRTTPELITAPATGLIIYNIATNLLCYWDGSQWETLCAISTGIAGAGGSQASVGATVRTDNSSPNQSAMLDVSATNKGVLIPRLTNVQRDAILPVTGLVIYNTSLNDIEFYNATSWYKLGTNLVVSPTAGTQVPSITQIIWNWNTVSGATGYKWNTTNNYSTAADMGTNTTKTETGLNCNTSYTRYAWAYNACGNSTPVTLNQTTLFATPANPLAGTHFVNVTYIEWKWNKVPGATGYKWNVVNNYNTATDMGPDTATIQNNLVCNSPYTTYVWAYNSCGGSVATMMMATTSNLVPGAPVFAYTNSSASEITWIWSPGLYTQGSKWNTTNNYNTAIDVGASYMYTETGLTCNTSYTRYIWDYNYCGVSPVTVITGSTLICWICGGPFTINHVAGAVAPVTKTVTYGTVNTIPGEPTKCWITQNLGADHQASAVNDVTEASAGWYWQFNRMQGYKYDIITRTPNYTWINSIIEQSDWTLAEDPCALLLAAPWRIPTQTEWYNVDNSGSWTDWNGPWSSGLKLHAAGNIVQFGYLTDRGSKGYYWSSYAGNMLDGAYNLYFNVSSSSLTSWGKDYGFPLRCIHD